MVKYFIFLILIFSILFLFSFIPKSFLLEKGLYFKVASKIPYLDLRVPFFFKISRSDIVYLSDEDQFSLVYEYFADSRKVSGLLSPYATIKYPYRFVLYVNEKTRISNLGAGHKNFKDRIDEKNYSLLYFQEETASLSKDSAFKLLKSFLKDSNLRYKKLKSFFDTLREQVVFLEDSLEFFSRLKTLSLPVEINSYNTEIRKEKILKELVNHHFDENTLFQDKFSSQDFKYKKIIYSELSSPDISLSAVYDLENKKNKILKLEVTYTLNQQPASEELIAFTQSITTLYGDNITIIKSGVKWVISLNLKKYKTSELDLVIQNLIQEVDFKIYK